MTLLLTRRPQQRRPPLVAELPAADSLLRVAAAHPDRAAAIVASHGRAGRSHPGPRWWSGWTSPTPAAWLTA